MQPFCGSVDEPNPIQQIGLDRNGGTNRAPSLVVLAVLFRAFSTHIFASPVMSLRQPWNLGVSYWDPSVIWVDSTFFNMTPEPSTCIFVPLSHLFPQLLRGETYK